MSEGSLCMYRQIMQPWQIFPTSDLNNINKIQTFKARYDVVCLRKNDDPVLLKELSSTFDFAAPNFNEIINCDHVLSPKEKEK